MPSFDLRARSATLIQLDMEATAIAWYGDAPTAAAWPPIVRWGDEPVVSNALCSPILHKQRMMAFRCVSCNPSLANNSRHNDDFGLVATSRRRGVAIWIIHCKRKSLFNSASEILSFATAADDVTDFMVNDKRNNPLVTKQMEAEDV